MRVLYFTRDYTPHDYRFLTSLAESGHTVTFLRLERRGRQLEDRVLPAAVRVQTWAGGQRPFRWRDVPVLLADLRRVLRAVQPQVVHAGPVQTAAFLCALAGWHPLVSMSWGSDMLKDADANAWMRWVTRYTLNRTDALVGDCQAVGDKAAALGMAREDIFLFPWGIDLQRFVPPRTSVTAPADAAAPTDAAVPTEPDTSPLRARLGWQDCFVVLSLRSWEPIYGVDVALRGFAQAVQAARADGQNPRLRLILLGGGSQASLVHQIIQENGLENCVYLGGHVNQNDLPALYQAADLYLSASHSDGSSVSLMEALGSGLPVLLSDLPSNREWVTQGAQGWFFADGDVNALADCLLLAARSPGVLSAMRQAARARAEARADWTKNFPVLLRAYAHSQSAGKP